MVSKHIVRDCPTVEPRQIHPNWLLAIVGVGAVGWWVAYAVLRWAGR